MSTTTKIHITHDDHLAIRMAFETIKFDLIVGLNMVFETQAEADHKRAQAFDTLARFGLVADNAWQKKVEWRYEASLESRSPHTFVRRHCAIMIDGKWVPNEKMKMFPF